MAHQKSMIKSVGGVSVVLRQVQRTAIANHAHVQGRARIETMLKDDLETQEIDIKLARAGFIKTAQDGGGA